LGFPEQLNRFLFSPYKPLWVRQALGTSLPGVCIVFIYSPDLTLCFAPNPFGEGEDDIFLCVSPLPLFSFLPYLMDRAFIPLLAMFDSPSVGTLLFFMRDLKEFLLLREILFFRILFFFLFLGSLFSFFRQSYAHSCFYGILLRKFFLNLSFFPSSALR